MLPSKSCLLQRYRKTLFRCRSPRTNCLKSLCGEFKGQTKPKATMMTVIVQRLSYWNGPSHVFTHKPTVSTWIFKNCIHSWVIRLLPGRKGRWGVMSTYASVYKTHTLLTMPSQQETSGWKWKIRPRAAALGAVKMPAFPVCVMLCKPASGHCSLTSTSLGSYLWSCPVPGRSLVIWAREQMPTSDRRFWGQNI